MLGPIDGPFVALDLVGEIGYALVRVRAWNVRRWWSAA